MLPSVDIRLSFKILLLLFLCAALVPSTESKPKEVGSEDAKSESSKVSLSTAVSSESPENHSSVTESELPSSKKPSKSKPKPKTKGKKNKKKPGKDKKNKKHSTEWSSEKPEMSSTGPTKDMWMSSEKSESSSMKSTWEASSAEPTEDTWKSSDKSESSSMKSTWKGSSAEPTEDTWKSSDKSESSSMKSTWEASSTEPCTDNMSESSEKSEKPGMGGNSEKTSTEPCTENMSDSSEKSENPGMEETTEDSNMCACSENMSEYEKTEEPCMEGMNQGSNWGKMMKGAIAPVFTPVGTDGEIDYSVIPKYMKYLHDSKVAGILVGGTTGEALTMTPCTRKMLLEHWLKAASEYDIQVMAQVGGADLPSVLDMAKHAQEAGACGLLVLPQLFYKPKDTEELVIYLKAVADQAPNIFLIYYDFPMMTGVTANTTELFDMATKRIPSFKGIKSDLKAVFEAGPLVQDGQQIYLGNQNIAPAVLMGHESSIATVNNMFLDQVCEIIEAMHSGDLLKARNLQKKLNKIVNEITDVGNFLGAMKVAFEITTGITIGPLRKPQSPFENEKRNRIRLVLKNNGVETRGN